MFRGVSEQKRFGSRITDKGVKTTPSSTNHYAGFAPGSINQFYGFWNGV